MLRTSETKKLSGFSFKDALIWFTHKLSLTKSLLFVYCLNVPVYHTRQILVLTHPRGSVWDRLHLEFWKRLPSPSSSLSSSPSWTVFFWSSGSPPPSPSQGHLSVLSGGEIERKKKDVEKNWNGISSRVGYS